jgi:hypothetical protein
MSRKQRTAARRVAAAYGILLGRPPKPDFGILVVLPLIAAAGGSLIGFGLDQAVTRRKARRTETTSVNTPATGPVPVSN